MIRYPFERLGFVIPDARSGIQRKTSILGLALDSGQAFDLPGMTRPTRTDQAEFV